MSSIDNLKAAVGKKGGLAQANRFLTIFTPPTQALVNLNPLDLVGRFANDTFNIKNLISDPRDIAFLCESTQLPGRNINTLDFQAEKETLKALKTFVLFTFPDAASINTVSLPVADNITGDCLPYLSANTIPT